MRFTLTVAVAVLSINWSGTPEAEWIIPDCPDTSSGSVPSEFGTNGLKSKATRPPASSSVATDCNRLVRLLGLRSRGSLA